MAAGAFDLAVMAPVSLSDMQISPETAIAETPGFVIPVLWGLIRNPFGRVIGFLPVSMIIRKIFYIY